MFGGYEVKTLGDAFMVAFTSTEDGVNFGCVCTNSCVKLSGLIHYLRMHQSVLNRDHFGED